MRVADQMTTLLTKHMGYYFYNYEADVVVREDESGNRHLKSLSDLNERFADKTSNAAWGIPTHGILNALHPITKEQYDSFGIEWDELTL